jgi:hypothetical protein
MPIPVTTARLRLLIFFLFSLVRQSSPIHAEHGQIFGPTLHFVDGFAVIHNLPLRFFGNYRSIALESESNLVISRFFPSPGTSLASSDGSNDS